MPPRRKAGGKVKPPSIAEQHAEWVRLLRPDGPFIAVPVLAAVLSEGLDTIPGPVFDRLRQAWSEVQAAPDLLHPAWCELVLRELLRYTGPALAEGAALPVDLRAWGPADPRVRPDGAAYGPDGKGGRAERLLLYRRPWDEPLTKATKDQAAAVDQAAETCRRRGTPLALLTNGPLWVLAHARPGEPATIATFDADLWLEEPALLRAFASLCAAARVLPAPTSPDGAPSTSLAGLFARSADEHAHVTPPWATRCAWRSSCSSPNWPGWTARRAARCWVRCPSATSTVAR
jgi:hypothetical protein